MENMMIPGLQTDVISALHTKQVKNFFHSGSDFSNHVLPYSHSHDGTGSRPQNIKTLAHNVTPARRMTERFIIPNIKLLHQPGQVWSRERKEKKYSYHDELTGLPNLRFLQNHFQQEISYAIRSKKHAGLLLINLNRFKEVNALLGHTVGNKLLCKVANRLTHCIGVSDKVFRYEDDKFVVIVSGINDKRALGVVSNKIHLCLEAPYLISRKGLIVGVSIGSAVFPTEGITFQEIFEKADADIHRIKTQQQWHEELRHSAL